MTKNHKEYVAGIVGILVNELCAVKKKLEAKYNLYHSCVETDRVWEHIVAEMQSSSELLVNEFVKNRGVVRKQRVSKNDERNDKDNKNSNDESNDNESNENKNTAFSNYCKTYRKRIRETNPGYKATQITKLLSDMWKNVPLTEREQFK